MFDAMNKQLTDIGVIPVIIINDAKDAHELGLALSQAGMKCAEVTFRTEAAAETIRIMSQDFPDLLVGAGTVMSREQVDAAIEAGAKFIDCPIMDTEVVDYCIDKGIPVYPGCATASEAAQGYKRGLRILKFFPAEEIGGVTAIEAISAVFKDLKFFPMGGIDKDNMRRYLASQYVAAVGGSWMVKSSFIELGKFDKIVKLAREAVYSAADARRVHQALKESGDAR